MTGVYSFRPAPSYRGASRQELFDAALDEPLSMSSTFFDQAKAGVLESFGAGTAIRQLALPDAAPTEPGLAMQTPEGEAITLPDTPQMRRRQTVQGVNVPRETAQQLDQRRADVKALSEDQYKSSAYFRKDILYDFGMTEDRAATLAAWYDAKKVREYYAEKRPITSFFGNLAGQALDPINYIPVAGPLVKAAAVAKFGRVGGNAAASALDAAANTAVFGLGTAGAREALGDDVSWQRMVSEIATAALIGGAFGTVGGLIGRRLDAKADTAIKERLSTLKTTQEARIALNEAIDGLARGEDVSLSPNATAALARIADNINPAKSPEVFAPLERQDLFRSTAVGRVIDGRAPHIADFEAFERGQVFLEDPALASKYNEAETKFGAAQERVAVLEEPLAARQQSDAVTLIDVPSADRLRSIEAEIAKSPPAKKRAALEAERDMIVESIGAERIAKVESDFRIGPQKQIKQARSALASARQEFSKIRREVDARAAQSNAVSKLRSLVSIDTTKARPEPIPEGRPQAETRIAKPDDYKALAAQYRIDPENGSYLEEPEVAQVAAEGRLSDADLEAMAEAQATYDNGAAYGEALKAAVGCLI